MKKFILLLTLMVFAVSLVGGSVFAWDRPYDEYYVPSGDDHPWGGEEAGPIAPRAGETTITAINYTTSYTLLSDVLIRLFSSSLFIKAEVEKSDIGVDSQTVTNDGVQSKIQRKAYLLEREGSR